MRVEGKISLSSYFLPCTNARKSASSGLSTSWRSLASRLYLSRDCGASRSDCHAIILHRNRRRMTIPPFYLVVCRVGEAQNQG